MKNVYILAILIFLSSSCFAQRSTFNKGGIIVKNYYQEIPYESAGGYLFVFPEIQGIKQKFLVDTGAPAQISAELSKTLGLKTISTAGVTDASGNKSELEIVILPEIKLGGLSFNTFPALVSSSELYACMQLDGVIGSNILRNTIIQIDPIKHLIIFTDDDSKLNLTKEHVTAISFGEPQSYPYINTGFGGKAVQTVGLDTGSPYFIVMAESHAQKFLKNSTLEKIASGYGSNSRSLSGSQKPDSLYRVQIPALHIAGTEFTNIITETNKSSKTRIGTKLMLQGVTTLDFIHKRFYFDFKDTGEKPDSSLWPVKFNVSNQKLIIGGVWDNMKSQINLGDEVISIDDQPTDTITFCEWFNKKSAEVMSKKNMTIKVKDTAGAIKTIRLDRG